MNGVHPRTWNILPLGCLLFLSACSTSGNPGTTTVVTPTPAAAPSLWAGAWGAAMTNAEPSAENAGGTDESFRFFVYPTIAGTEERVRLSNPYGTNSITIGGAHLSVGHEGSPAIDSTRDATLLFSGQPQVTLAPGQVITSDPVNITYTYGEALAISVYLKGQFGPVSRHSSYFVNNYRTAANAGDQTASTTGTAYTTTQKDWFLITGVDVYGQYQGTLAMYGSSTTDGFKSDYDSTASYPTPNVAVADQHMARLSDWMARRLNAAGYHIGVVNLGIPGDTVTDDITNTLNHVKNANQRFGQDILNLGTPNLLGVVSYFGSIDLRSPDCESAPAMEAATTRLAAQAAAAKLPLVLATLPPSGFCTNSAQPNFGPSPSAANPYAGGITPGPANGAEVQRAAFNTWMRSTGASLPGVAGIADLDQALADPAHTSFMLPLYNSGDNYHPNGQGYKAEAGAVPLSFLPAPK